MTRRTKDELITFLEQGKMYHSFSTLTVESAHSKAVILRKLIAENDLDNICYVERRGNLVTIRRIA